MKIAFTGHRDRKVAEQDLLDLFGEYPRAIWVHGGAIGFDSQVGQFAQAHGIEQVIIRPDYERYGKPAPLIRNRAIVDDAALLIACYDGRKHGGTFYTINYAHKRDIPIRLLPCI